MSLLGEFFGDADAGGDVDGGIDVDAADGADGVAEGGSEIGKLLSLRSITYALFGFGGAGLVMHLTLGASSIVGALVAGGVGIGSAALVNTVFGYLRRSEAGQIPGAGALAGLPGRITLPISGSDTGEVRIRSGDRQIRVRARLHDPGETGAETLLSSGAPVVVTEVRSGVAYVAPLDGDDVRLIEE